MSAENGVVQFVCFETPLPRADFVPGWVPIAGRFLVQGLRNIVLSERVGRSGEGPPYDFTSRNRWLPEADADAVRSGRIGDGAGGAVRAVQGGTFSATEPVPESFQSDRDKVMAFLAVVEHQRFGLVAEAYGAHGQGANLASLLESSIAGLVDPDRSTVAVYREALALNSPLVPDGD